MRMHHIGNGEFKRCVAKSDDSCNYGPGKVAGSFHGSSMDGSLSWYEAQREGETFATSQSTGGDENMANSDEIDLKNTHPMRSWQNLLEIRFGGMRPATPAGHVGAVTTGT